MLRTGGVVAGAGLALAVVTIFAVAAPGSAHGQKPNCGGKALPGCKNGPEPAPAPPPAPGGGGEKPGCGGKQLPGCKNWPPGRGGGGDKRQNDDKIPGSPGAGTRGAKTDLRDFNQKVGQIRSAAARALSGLAFLGVMIGGCLLAIGQQSGLRIIGISLSSGGAVLLGNGVLQIITA